MTTAEKIYRAIIDMPITEREKLFATIARKGFEKDNYTHDEVFEEIRKTPFSTAEAAEYLEVAEITLRRWVKNNQIPFQKFGRNLIFDPDELKRFKQSRKH